MDTRYALAFLLLPLTGSAQTINSVQNGNWTDPGTWSCGCVPGSGSSLVISHTLQIMGDLTLNSNQVQVTPAGDVQMSFPANITITCVLTLEGHMFLQGNILNQGGTINVFGTLEVAGTFVNNGELIMDGGFFQVEGDLQNILLIDGLGSICVYDSTDNQGTINGTVDVCDATPTTSIAPIVDLNTGTIAGTVTYCTNSVCGFAGVKDDPWVNVGLHPNPAVDGHVMLTGTRLEVLSITLVDATGRPAREWDAPGDLQLNDLDPGTYLLIVRGTNGLKALPLVIE